MTLCSLPFLDAKLCLMVPDTTALSPTALQKPFVLVGDLPEESELLAIRPVPNVLELMGMGSGGGPPGFIVLCPDCVEKKHRRYWVGLKTGSKITLRGPNIQLVSFAGACSSAGTLLSYFEMEFNSLLAPEAVSALIDEIGYVQISLIEHHVPPGVLSI